MMAIPSGWFQVSGCVGLHASLDSTRLARLARELFSVKNHHHQPQLHSFDQDLFLLTMIRSTSRVYVEE